MTTFNSTTLANCYERAKCETASLQQPHCPPENKFHSQWHCSIHAMRETTDGVNLWFDHSFGNCLCRRPVLFVEGTSAHLEARRPAVIHTYMRANESMNANEEAGPYKKKAKKKTKYYKIEKTLKERTTEIGNMLYMLCSHTYNFIYWFWFGAAAAIKWFFFSVLFSPAGLAGNCVCGLVSPMRYHYDSGLVLILLYRMNDFPKAYTMHQNFA